MKLSLWRTWFTIGIGGSFASMVSLYVLGGWLPTVSWVWFALCATGLLNGSYRVIVRRENPFKYFS